MTALLERLGLRQPTRALIISAQGLGVSHATNLGVLSALRLGAATSTAIMMPCPWSRHAAATVLGRTAAHDDIGVQLTLNAEYAHLRWGPLTYAPSLLDGEGGFPRTTDDLWEHADPDEVRRESRAQIERAAQWGFHPTHLGSHLSALLLRPELFDVLLELAVEFALPLRLPPPALEQRCGFPLRRLAADRGVLHADRVIVGRGRDHVLETISTLEPGVTELVLRPAQDTPELRAYAPGWTDQVAHHQLLLGDAELQALLADVHLLGYGPLRVAQRAGAPPSG